MIQAENLVKDYGSFRAVDNVSFEVRRGDILGFLGPNGAGKSTTMKMITGFLPPTAGTASIDGHDIRKEPIAAKRLFGYLPENGPLYGEMTVLEFLKFVAEMRDLGATGTAAAIERVTGICHLEEVSHQPIETLSKGFRQRVGMAQAVLHDPPCLIMDEPTDGLDPNQKQEVRKLIASMAREKAIILSTHILEEVQAMCNRVIIIARGKILVNETPDDLLKRHPRYHSVRLAIDRRKVADAGTISTELRSLPAVASVEDVDNAFIVHPKGESDLKPHLWRVAHEKDWPIHALEPAETRLEDVFRDLTKP